MKEPDEWSGPVDRWMPALMATFMLLMLVFYIVTGPVSVWLLGLHTACVVFGYAVQLEYELKAGVLS